MEGPKCTCGHDRARHTGPGYFDGPCTDCPCTPCGYRPDSDIPYHLLAGVPAPECREDVAAHKHVMDSQAQCTSEFILDDGTVVRCGFKHPHGGQHARGVVTPHGIHTLRWGMTLHH